MGTYSKKQRHDQHRTRDRVIHSFLSSALILFLIFLPIAAPAERFGAAIYTVSAVGSSSAGASPFAVYHRLSWVPESTVATCTMKLESSLDGASWSTIVGPATCTSAGFATSTAVTARYVRVNVTALTGGRVLVGYSGYDSDPAGAGVSAVSVTSGTINSATISSMPAITGTVQANAGTGTLGIDLAKVLGAALTTANPVIDGGRASTDTTASVADGVARALRLDKFGDVVFVVAPQDLQTSVRAALTNTTASSMISAPGANYKYAITLLSACNLAATIAGNVDITDSSGTLFTFPWTQTSSAPGEPRCIVLNLGDGDPIYAAANSSISAKASVANGTGFTINIAAHKTGT